MSENVTYTLDSAKEFFNDNNALEKLKEMPNEQLIALSKGLYDENAYPDDDVAAYRDWVNQEELDRLAKFEQMENYIPEELDGIIALANKYAGITGSHVDVANKIVEKASKQKEEMAKQQLQNDEQNDKNVEVEELTFPEVEPAKDMDEKEFNKMMDPLSENMPEMTEEERKRQAERLEAVMSLAEQNKYESKYHINNTIDFTIEQSAIRRLVVSHDEITKEALDAVRAGEAERINVEYFNAVYGACKTENELDEETAEQHVERLGKIADLLNQNKSKEEIYKAIRAAM